MVVEVSRDIMAILEDCIARGEQDTGSSPPRRSVVNQQVLDQAALKCELNQELVEKTAALDSWLRANEAAQTAVRHAVDSATHAAHDDPSRDASSSLLPRSAAHKKASRSPRLVGSRMVPSGVFLSGFCFFAFGGRLEGPRSVTPVTVQAPSRAEVHQPRVVRNGLPAGLVHLRK